MDETLRVGVREPGRNLDGNRPRLVVVERPSRGKTFLECPARQVLERHVWAPTGLAVVVDPRHVVVVEGGRRASLTLEAGAVGIRSQQLECNRPLELEVGREPHLGHRPLAELTLEPVTLAEDVAAHQGYGIPVRPELLTREEALARVLERARPLSAEAVALGDAAGRFVAEEARAAVDLPPFASSAMDGFAVRAADTPGRLPIVARIAAGVPAPRPLEPGEAMAIATGGVVPPGADSVIPIEYVVENGNNVEIAESVVHSANVRPRGGDVAANDVVVARGVRLGPAQIGALAAAGLSQVHCARRPRCAVLTTGTELRRPGEALGPGQVYEANGVLLATALASAGAEVEELPAVADEEAAHRAALERGLAVDVLVTSGGVSVGPHDLVRRILGELGVEEVFWGVAVKPGKPLAFGVRGSTLVFGLPGNPVSSLVGCELFVRPALLALQGASSPGPVFQEGRLASTVRRNAHRDELLRARAVASDNGLVLEPVTGQESHMIARAANADALVLAPRGEGELVAGEIVRYLPLA
jgi:molybdopterin molybdotransferase